MRTVRKMSGIFLVFVKLPPWQDDTMTCILHLPKTMFATREELQEKAHGIVALSDPTTPVLDQQALKKTFIDPLISTAVFAQDVSLKQYARKLIFQIAERTGAHSRSIYPLYKAFGEGKVAGFTIPAINIRTLTYDTARLVLRIMQENSIGAVVFEIARSEIEYTHQRPEEYAASVLAAAIKEGYSGPIFLQGDHYQFSKSTFENDQETEISRLKTLIKESIQAHFYNIDIDASTLVDLTKSNIAEQQHLNSDMTALLTQYIRSLEPNDQAISIGGEIGHIGGKNSTPSDFEAFMQGYQQKVSEKGLSKISVQTGSSHGGTVLPDGTIQKVTIDFSVLQRISEVARKKFHLGGAVQHGASTLPLTYFDQFVSANTLEIHLATGFQNIVYDTMPKDLQHEINEWLKENLADEKEEGWNEEQFLYKTRKKAFGPFKQPLWELSSDEKLPILKALEKQLTTIFSSLRVFHTKEIVSTYVS